MGQTQENSPGACRSCSFNLSRRSVPVLWIAGGSRMPLRQPRLFAELGAVITNGACWNATATKLSVQLELRFVTARIAPTWVGKIAERVLL